ncbi:ArsR family transcriptional regulator [Breoghania corrubedonensis]|uniref:ArsR family transcriptional regulator n=1 Tax=Breoghania corrubedonensis TaxID=665038 RepID=A0A2T5VB14_9HYPH|nr:metalloregulator ArsR/SmtB family transcription factor [Breoghania corrubedonensis]PTW60942.1 ArsR family transcriptional regulator [Breoghania corrubedonensis]
MSSLSDDRLAACFKAFAHPARLAILRELADNDRRCCGDIVGMLPLAQSTVSQHLHILREAGLIRGEIDGRRSCYCLDGEAVRAFMEGSAALFALLGETEEKCATGPAPVASAGASATAGLEVAEAGR